MWRWLSLVPFIWLGACSSESPELADHNTCLELGFEAWMLDYSYCRLTLLQGRTGNARFVLLPPKTAKPRAERGAKETSIPETSAEDERQDEPPEWEKEPSREPQGHTKEPPPPTPVRRPAVKAGEV